MAKTEKFALRLEENERGMVDYVADRLQRNRSDAIRWLIRQAAMSLANLAGQTEFDTGNEQE
jgi:hypothetical protein